MRIRMIIYTLIAFCIISGLVAGIYSRNIEAALTIQPLKTSQSLVPQGATPTPTKLPVTGQLTPTSSATSLPVGVSMLARDTFQRAAQVFWGVASDGNAWRGDANSLEIFSITNDMGMISGGQGAFNAMLGPTSAEADVVASASINQFAANGTVNIGVVLRWTDGNDWYKALINGSQLQILSRIKGASKVLASMPFTARGGVFYFLRFKAMGANLFAKVWQTGQPEPANWSIQTVDTALAQGIGGIRVVLQSATVIQVTSFTETTIPATE